MRFWNPRGTLGVVSSALLATTGLGGQLTTPLEAIADVATLASTAATSPETVNPPRAATSVWRHLGKRVPATDEADFGTRAATSIRRTSQGYIQTRVGCMADSSAATMNREFRDRIGPLIGWDNPHVISLGGNRYLWLVHDSYMDYRFAATTLAETRPQIQNLAMIQNGTCFTLYHRGTTDRPLNFEPGTNADPPNTFFWPLGGQLHNGRIKVFWAKMQYTDIPQGPKDGITRHPIGTWVAEYDPVTLKRLSFREAPTSGVKAPSPFSQFIVQYGFAVSSDERYSYLFGNTNMLNLAVSGGYDNGPHPATRMYLARVPLGQFNTAPEYRTQTGWSRDSRQAAVVSQRFWTENTMQPKRLGKKKWVAVTKEDGFFGNEVFIDVARSPWGPWRTARRYVHETRYGNETGNSYQPILLPQRDANGDLNVVIAENAWNWDLALDTPRYYRPSVRTVDWPFPD